MIFAEEELVCFACIHLVFVAKYRKKIFTKEILKELSAIFQSVCKDFDANLVEFEGEKDHVHLLINYPPKVSVSRLVILLAHVEEQLWMSFGNILKTRIPPIREMELGNGLYTIRNPICAFHPGHK